MSAIERVGLRAYYRVRRRALLVSGSELENRPHRAVTVTRRKLAAVVLAVALVAGSGGWWFGTERVVADVERAAAVEVNPWAERAEAYEEIRHIEAELAHRGEDFVPLGESRRVLYDQTPDDPRRRSAWVKHGDPLVLDSPVQEATTRELLARRAILNGNVSWEAGEASAVRGVAPDGADLPNPAR